MSARHAKCNPEVFKDALVEGSKFGCTFAGEMKERIMAGIDDVNRHPVIHTWSYKLAEAA